MLFAEDFLHVADFLLDLAGDFFVGAAISQVGIADRFSALLFNFAFGFPQTALDLIFSARFHHYGIARKSASGWIFQKFGSRCRTSGLFACPESYLIGSDATG
jgi:hypothetical protein